MTVSQSIGEVTRRSMPSLPLHIYEERKASSKCVQCRRPAAEDSSRCRKHRDAKRKRDRESAARIKAARRRAGQCVGCKLPSTSYRCPACAEKSGHARGPAPGSNLSADKQARIAATTRKHADGRVRYHGQAKRGSQPIAQLDAQDHEAALRMIAAGYTRLGIYRSAAVQAMPRIQHESVKLQACQEIDHGAAFLESILERNGHPRADRRKLEGDE